MPRYRAFGTIIESDVELAALVPARDGEESGDSPILVELCGDRLGRLPPPRGEETDWYRAGDAEEQLRITIDAAGDFRFLYADGTRFFVRADGDSVIGCRPRGMSMDDASEYLLGPVLGFALRQRGHLCLHAAAIAVEDHCFAVLAPAGHGKSTMAAACARLGWSVLTDDVLALRQIDGAFWVQPAYPRVRLWPDAAGGLFGSADALPRLSPANDAWDKRYLDLSAPGRRFRHDPLPLRRIYLPHYRDDARPRVEPLPRAQALVELLANVYTRSRPHRPQRAGEFATLDRLARTVPVKRALGPPGFEHLPALCRILRRDCSGRPSERQPVGLADMRQPARAAEAPGQQATARTS